MHREEDPEAAEWLAEFREKLYDSLDGGTVAGLQAVDDDVREAWFGWHTSVAELSGDSWQGFELWLDTYLDGSGPHHLGCWYQTTQTEALALRSPLRAAWGADDVPIYRQSHRGGAEYRLLRASGRRELLRIPAPIVDLWYGEAYVGLYVATAPMRERDEDLMDRVIDALRRLVEAVRTARGEHDEVEDYDGERNEVRRRRMCEVLARPNQQALRHKAIEQHRACVVSGETVLEGLEAAHILPVYRGGQDRLDNVLLLRADLHRLFDAGLLTIWGGPRPYVRVARSVIRAGSSYPAFSRLVGGATITTGQWLALDARNSEWDEDLGLSHVIRVSRESPLLVPSPALGANE